MQNIATDKSLNLHIQFRHMEPSAAIKQLIQEYAAKLPRFGAESGLCTVVIDETHHWNKGGIYHVSARLKVPRKKLLISTIQQESTQLDHLHSAIRLAFEDIERQLKKQKSKRRRYTAEQLTA
ncbi:HPF/RaiA family ribosome-associated protein [Tichowtungia aerotolerans]|uniref:Ribosomal subunit interface protein n=1 Tax=Tichowtungia aerotolerans TaxID=2697043 RepID=A0A6P1MG96_9BACT|nr:HPF/RaiA family ribosome-associated protein [Tichowtungia aerotolerans]QHI70105.1 hypothetical protein GT409_11840 [Tichowtungia aerotolerans]